MGIVIDKFLNHQIVRRLCLIRVLGRFAFGGDESVVINVRASRITGDGTDVSLNNCLLISSEHKTNDDNLNTSKSHILHPLHVHAQLNSSDVVMI